MFFFHVYELTPNRTKDLRGKTPVWADKLLAAMYSSRYHNRCQSIKKTVSNKNPHSVCNVCFDVTIFQVGKAKKATKTQRSACSSEKGTNVRFWGWYSQSGDVYTCFLFDNRCQHFFLPASWQSKIFVFFVDCIQGCNKPLFIRLFESPAGNAI